ncbi:hypothetical protein SCYAM73S_03339 [Streptomyces cyaneofuscatus]
MRRDGERPSSPAAAAPTSAHRCPRPLTLRYDRDEEALRLDEGRVSPVPPQAWDFEVGGARVLEQWFAARTAEAEPGTLAGRSARRPGRRPGRRSCWS